MEPNTDQLNQHHQGHCEDDFLTRQRGPFWSIRPARVLWVVVLGTQLVATLIAVYGLFMTPLGWGLGSFRLGLCSGVVLVNDRVKLLTYRVFDPTAAPLLAKQPVEVTPQIAKRAYELYERQGRRAGHAVQGLAPGGAQDPER